MVLVLVAVMAIGISISGIVSQLSTGATVLIFAVVVVIRKRTPYGMYGSPGPPGFSVWLLGLGRALGTIASLINVLKIKIVKYYNRHTPSKYTFSLAGVGLTHAK